MKGPQYPGVRSTHLLVALVTLAVLPGCPSGKSKGGGTTVGKGEMPAAVQTYAALRFVPADASYALAGRSAADLTATLAVLAEVGGILGDFDADEVAGESRQAFGYDITSAESLTGIGIDVQRGAAIWGTGLSPTFAVGLADKARFEEFIDQMRSQGLSIQSQIADGAEVFTIAFGGGEVMISWALVDDWILARFELMAERQPELGWLRSARGAAGALGGHPDFLAALELDADAPVVGVVRPGAIADALVTLASSMESPDAGRMVDVCLAPVRDASRALISVRVNDDGAGGTIALDLVNRSRFETNVVPASAGWYATREGAPFQLDVGLDLAGYARTIAGCPVEVDDLAQLGVRTAHLAIQSFEDGLPARAGAYADLTTDQTIRGFLSNVKGLSMFSKKRMHGGIEVVDVKVPMFLSLTYHLSAALGVAGMGEGQFDAILAADGEVRSGEVLHVDLRPHEIPTETFDLVLGQVLGMDGDQAERTVRRLRRWQHGVIDARLDGDRLTIKAAGDRHR
jgi:hypothetical protein